MTALPRAPNLLPSLLRYAKAVSETLPKIPQLMPYRPSDSFMRLCLPWLADIDLPSMTDGLRNWLVTQKAPFLAAGFDGQPFAEELKQIRDQDQQLAECCPTVVLLASHFSRNFISEAIPLLQSKNSEAIDRLFQRFEQLTYGEGRFTRIAFTHIFNLNIEGSEINLDTFRIVRLSDVDIRLILGEAGYRTFLHPNSIGDCFLRVEDGPSDIDDDTWVNKRHSEAHSLAMALQYFKDGVVHVGYTVPFYNPRWAHDLRREGVFFIGNTRRVPYDSGNAKYQIAKEEAPDLVRYLKVIRNPFVARMLQDRTSNLKQAITRAGDYFEKSHYEPFAPERLVYLAIALESLFSPSNQEQLSFKISQTAAQFLGESPEEKIEVFKEVRDLYSRRSKLVHGGYDVEKYVDGTFVTNKEIEKWSSLVRRSILGFFMLALKGEKARQSILTILENSAFDGRLAQGLRLNANVDMYLDRMLTSHSPEPIKSPADD